MFIKEFIYCLLAATLLIQWKNSEKRYYTDIPFLLGVTFICQAIQHSFDISYVLFPTYYGSLLANILILIQFIMISTVMILLFITMLNIWFENKPKIKMLGSIIYAIIVPLGFTIIILVDYSLVAMMMSILGIPTFLALGITFIFAYRQKRLSNINPLLIGIGSIMAMTGYLLHGVFSEIGILFVDIYTTLSFLGVIVEIVAYGFFQSGVLRAAPYA